MFEQLTYPTRCPDGHPVGPGHMLLGWISCTCHGATYGGHRVVYCWEMACRHRWIQGEHTGPVEDQR